jgi:hypothetical protein
VPDEVKAGAGGHHLLCTLVAIGREGATRYLEEGCHSRCGLVASHLEGGCHSSLGEGVPLIGGGVPLTLQFGCHSSLGGGLPLIGRGCHSSLGGGVPLPLQFAPPSNRSLSDRTKQKPVVTSVIVFGGDPERRPNTTGAGPPPPWELRACGCWIWAAAAGGTATSPPRS